MRALSIRQPWAWLILHAGKDIENRTWAPGYRGRFLIHASKGMTRYEYVDTIAFAQRVDLKIVIPEFNDLERGGIVGVAEIVDVVDRSESPWFCGPFGLVLRDVKPVPFVPLKGQLGFFCTEIDL